MGEGIIMTGSWEGAYGGSISSTRGCGSSLQIWRGDSERKKSRQKKEREGRRRPIFVVRSLIVCVMDDASGASTLLVLCNESRTRLPSTPRVLQALVTLVQQGQSPSVYSLFAWGLTSFLALVSPNPPSPHERPCAFAPGRPEGCSLVQ